MAIAPVRPQDIDEVLSQQNGPLTKLYKVAAPFTTIVNRAQVTDSSKDLISKFGINRVMIEAVQEVQGETGPNGERVFKPINDFFDQIRLVGSWTNAVDTAGQRPVAGSATDYIEVVFYGTGLNFLFQAYTTHQFSYSIDGGTTTSFYSATPSSILNARNYSANNLIPVISGLTQGTHTIRITSPNATMQMSGFEIVNTSWIQPPGVSYLGGKKLSKPTLTTDSYNSNFESGVLGTKGGHAVVYQKADGSVAKAVNPTDTTALYLTAATHANESMIRPNSPREFGAGRTDDFSITLGGTRAFTLDDGTTTLTAGPSIALVSGTEAITLTSVSDFFTLTFVGTGLDVKRLDASTATSDTISVNIDGTSIGNMSTSGSTAVRFEKIVSGLPYGTHTVRFTRNVAAGNSVGFLSFVTYSPVKPSIPAGSVEIADYYIFGSYAQVTSIGLVAGPVSTGVLRKLATRELIYTGTWSTPALDITAMNCGFDINSGTAASTSSYTFFGTGVDLGLWLTGGGAATNVTISIDGSTNLSVYTTNLVQNSTGTTFTPSTGALGGTPTLSGKNSLAITNIPLGLHTVKITQNGTALLYIDNIDVVTPTHSPKSNAPGDIQNTQMVGSQALGDSRKFAVQTVKALSNWSQAVGVTSGPSTTSTSAIPAPDMSCVIKTSGNPIEVFYSIEWSNSTAGTQTVFQIYVDGVPVGTVKAPVESSTNGNQDISDSFIYPVSAGTHIVQVFWFTSSGTATLVTTRRNLKAREI